MAFTPVDAVPDISRAGKASQALDEFMESGQRAVLVEGDDVAKTFGASLRRAAKQQELPVEVLTRAGKTYLRRTDLDGEQAQG